MVEYPCGLPRVPPSPALIQVHCLLAARPTRVNVDKRGIMGAIRPILVFRCRAVSPIITQSLCGPPCLTRPAGSVITSPEDREQKNPRLSQRQGPSAFPLLCLAEPTGTSDSSTYPSVLAHRLRIIVELLVLVAPAGKCRGRRRAVENARESAGRGACFPTLMRSGGEPASTPTPTHHSPVCVHGEDTHEKSVPSRQSRRFSGWVRDDF